jgi:hypothetical protein
VIDKKFNYFLIVLHRAADQKPLCHTACHLISSIKEESLYLNLQAFPFYKPQLFIYAVTASRSSAFAFVAPC